MFKAVITVTLKESVLDPQGVAVLGSLHSMGYAEVDNVRIGKHIEVNIDVADKAQAEEQVHAICDKMLANPVIENFRFQLEEVI